MKLTISGKYHGQSTKQAMEVREIDRIDRIDRTGIAHRKVDNIDLCQYIPKKLKNSEKNVAAQQITCYAALQHTVVHVFNS